METYLKRIKKPIEYIVDSNNQAMFIKKRNFTKK